MTNPARLTPREAYLASLPSTDELATRRAADKSGIPDDDPMWLLLAEVRRACSAANQCTLALQQAVSDAAQRIERVASRDARSPAFDNAYITHIAGATGASIAKDAQVTNAVASAIRQIEADATRALRTTETSIRELMRRRSATPIASLTFAFALGVTSAAQPCGAATTPALPTGKTSDIEPDFTTHAFTIGVTNDRICPCPGAPVKRARARSAVHRSSLCFRCGVVRSSLRDSCRNVHVPRWAWLRCRNSPLALRTDFGSCKCPYCGESPSARFRCAHAKGINELHCALLSASR